MFSHGAQRALNNPVFASWTQTWFTEGCDELVISWSSQGRSGCLLSQECPLRLCQMLRFDTRGTQCNSVLGSDMASCWSTAIPFGTKNMKNGLIPVCPYSVRMCSHTLSKEGLSVPVIPCTLLSISYESSQNVTYSPWNLCDDPKTSQLFPSKFLCHARKSRGMSPLCSCPLCWPFPSHMEFSAPKMIKNHIYLQIWEARVLQLW